MKTQLNSKRHHLAGMITLIEAVFVVCIFVLAAVAAVAYFGNKASEARAEVRHASLTATVTKAPARPVVKKTEAVVLQERVDAKVAELQALTEATVTDPDDGKKALALAKELAELKKLQAMGAPAAGTQKK